jgi:hypothetical protein
VVYRSNDSPRTRGPAIPDVTAGEGGPSGWLLQTRLSFCAGAARCAPGDQRHHRPARVESGDPRARPLRRGHVADQAGIGSRVEAGLAAHGGANHLRRGPVWRRMTQTRRDEQPVVDHEPNAIRSSSSILSASPVMGPQPGRDPTSLTLRRGLELRRVRNARPLPTRRLQPAASGGSVLVKASVGRAAVPAAHGTPQPRADDRGCREPAGRVARGTGEERRHRPHQPPRTVRPGSSPSRSGRRTPPPARGGPR